MTFFGSARAGMRRFARIRRGVCLVVLLGLTGGGVLASRTAAAQAARDERAVEAQQLFVRGLTKAYLDDHEAALELFKAALRLVPREAAILSAAAVSEEALGDNTTALFYAEQARSHAPDNPYYHHQLAQLQLRAGNVSTAVQTYEALLDRFPNDHEALRELAQLQSMMGRSREAIATYERLIERAGDHPQVRRQILQLYFRLGDEVGTRRSLEALIALEPEDPAPWRLLGQLYLQQQKPDEALEAFEQAYEVNPNDFETVLALADLYRQTGREDDANGLLDRAMAVENATITELLTRAAPLYSRAGADAEAALAATRLLERAVEIAPDNAEALLMLGDLRFQQGRYEEAARLLERALAHNPRDPHLWMRAAAAHLESGQAGEAVRVAEEGLLLFPGQLPLLRVAAYSLMQVNRNDEAIARFDEMLAILEEEAPDEAAERSEALAALGLLHARKKDQEASDAFYQQALALHPDNTLALNNYAYGLAERGTRLAEAREMARRAVALDPQNPSYLDTLGWIYFKLNQFDEARKWIGQAVDLGPVSAAVYDHYGDVHARLGDFDAARSFWRKALDLSPGNQALQLKLERQMH